MEIRFRKLPRPSLVKGVRKKLELSNRLRRAEGQVIEFSEVLKSERQLKSIKPAELVGKFREINALFLQTVQQGRSFVHAQQAAGWGEKPEVKAIRIAVHDLRNKYVGFSLGIMHAKRRKWLDEETIKKLERLQEGTVHALLVNEKKQLK